MINAAQFYARFGDPASQVFKDTWLTVWDVPAELEVGFIPKKIYCNKALEDPLTKAFTLLKSTGAYEEIKTWDGCWNLRPTRGYEDKYRKAVAAGNTALAVTYLSLHSWACAVDINAAENGFNQPTTFSPKFIKCFTDSGFDWGGSYIHRPDPMHFQLATLPPK